MASTPITVSIVSHGQIGLVNQLLEDLSRYCASELRVIVTHNIPEPGTTAPRTWKHRLETIVNADPRGFGANHNAAFRRSETPLFCVVNPDIRLTADPFPVLAKALDRARVAAAGPLVQDPNGNPEDSARKFPTARGLLRKLVTAPSGPDYAAEQGLVEVDWVAGMFMAFRADAFKAVQGFDERFFLYYEDVDICRRLRRAGYMVVYDPRTSVIHHARRASRRNVRLMAIHAASAMRYLLRRYN